MKICLTTFVQGHLYQEYLPMLIYSIGKAYPEYDVKIFLHDTLRDDLRPALDMIRSTYDRFEIREHTFADCPNMNSLVARSLRWVLWDESFRDYDYLYTIDIDMFYIREPQELMEQHIEHMNYIGSDCVSNFDITQIINDLRIALIQSNGSLKILSAAPAASKHPQSLLQDHTCIDRYRILGYTENRHGSLRLDMIDHLIDRTLGSCATHTLKGVIYQQILRNVIDIKCGICKGKGGHFLLTDTKNIKLCVREGCLK